MIEYLDPVTLPSLDRTAIPYRWRSVLQGFDVVDASLYHQDALLEGWKGLQLVAVSSKRGSYVRVLCGDGQQCAFKRHEGPSHFVHVKEQWDLEAFLVPVDMTRVEEIRSSIYL